MECNKGDAQMAKEIAEKKFLENDIAGAKKFAVKAQNMYPELDGLSQFIATLDVYISAEHKIDGEIDWYRVLNVAPSADDDTIRKNYRRLALVLHPDKNKSIGADGAFKILSEAWCVLSDKARRYCHDQKRLSRVFNQKYRANVPVPAGEKGSNNFAEQKHSVAKTQKSSMSSKPADHHPYSKANTFWTICNGCRTLFEYLKVYRCTKLLCQNCQKPFLGIEVQPPNINGYSSPSMPFRMQGQASMPFRMQGQASMPFRMQGQTSMPFRMQGQAPAQNTRTEYPHSTGKKPVSTTKKENASHSGSIVSGLASASEFAKLNRRHVETKTTVRTGAVSGFDVKGNGLKTKRPIDEQRMHNIKRESASQTSHGSVGGSAYQKTSIKTGSVDMREVLLSKNIRDALINKAKSSISEMLKKWDNVAAAPKNMEKGMKSEENTRKKSGVKGRNAEKNNFQGLEGGRIGVQSKKPCPATHDDIKDPVINVPTSMNVLDPDFHNFDEDRAEKSFVRNQVWAAYDDDDGMPRFYAMIQDVISLKPFKMRISWLNTKSNQELSPLSWLDSGFYKTSGEFWIGKHEMYKSLNAFSHEVKWTKGARGSVHIYPKKGDVWALYRNWSRNWNELTPNEVIHKYDMVEILEDYNKDTGVTVAFLIKVAGFKAVFRRQSEPNKRVAISREEMFRLSHQIPSHLLTGEEGNNVPTGCLELDPASTPLELLQVLTEAQVEELMKAAEGAKENDKHQDAEIGNQQEQVDNAKTSKRKIEPDNALKNDAKKVRKNEEKDNKETNVLVYKRRS